MNLKQIKKELEFYLSDYEGGFNHRNAIRYLSKRKPSLWFDIIQLTSFLPNDAKPKQRCWHVLNDVYDRPKCPITDKFTKIGLRKPRSL